MKESDIWGKEPLCLLIKETITKIDESGLSPIEYFKKEFLCDPKVDLGELTDEFK